MPIACERCGHALQVGDWPYCPHGPTGSFSVVNDSIRGGVVMENLDSKPTRYYSRSAIKLRADVLGVENRVRHMPEPGSDKSPFTSRWI